MSREIHFSFSNTNGFNIVLTGHYWLTCDMSNQRYVYFFSHPIHVQQHNFKVQLAEAKHVKLEIPFASFKRIVLFWLKKPYLTFQIEIVPFS